MTALSRPDAQRRAEDIVAFQRELSRLEQSNVLALSSSQKLALTDHHRQLLARYAQDFDIDPNVHAKQLSLGMRIASFLGALALAASAFFLFYQFWGWLGTPAQVAILIGSALVTFAATVMIRERDATGHFTNLAAMVSFACFVLNVVMLGQIFNITPSDKAFLPWAAFAFLLAYSCESRLLLAAGILCTIGLVSARIGTWSGIYWMNFGMRPENFFPVAIMLFLLPEFVSHSRFVGFAPLYRIFGLLTFFLPALILANWGQGSYLDIDPKFLEGMYQVFGFAGGAAAIWLGVRRQQSEVVNTSITFFVIFFYTKLFDWWWELMPKYLFFLVLAATAIAILVALRHLRNSNFRLLRGSAPK